MKKKLRVLKLLSFTLIFTLLMSTAASAESAPKLIYNDLEEPTYAHKVTRGNSSTIESRPKYYDDERNALYASELTEVTASTDPVFERQKVTVNSEDIIPEQSLELLDTSKVYMDYVHQYAKTENGVTKTIPLAVFGNDMMEPDLVNQYNTFPAKETALSSKEEEVVDDEDYAGKSNPEDMIRDDGTSVSESSVDRPYASELLDRRSNVSMNIYPDRKEVVDGGEYTVNDSQVVYKVFRSLDNSKTETVLFQDDIEVIDESELGSHTVTDSTKTVSINKDEAIGVNEDGSYATKLGTVVTNADTGKSTFEPSTYWKISVPATSIHDDVTVLDYAKYVKDHYGKNISYGSDYFVYKDPGTTDISYERQLSQYYNDVDEADSFTSVQASYESSKEQTVSFTNMMKEAYPEVGKKLENVSSGKRIDIVAPDPNYKVPGKVEIDGLTVNDIPKLVSDQMNATLNTFFTVGSDKRYTLKSNISSVMGKVPSGVPAASITNNLASQITRIDSKIEEERAKAVSANNEEFANYKLFELLRDPALQEIDASEYNSSKRPGIYLKMSIVESDAYLDSVTNSITETYTNTVQPVIKSNENASSLIEQLVSEMETLADYNSELEQTLNEASTEYNDSISDGTIIEAYNDEHDTEITEINGVPISDRNSIKNKLITAANTELEKDLENVIPEYNKNYNEGLKSYNDIVSLLNDELAVQRQKLVVNYTLPKKNRVTKYYRLAPTDNYFKMLVNMATASGTEKAAVTEYADESLPGLIHIVSHGVDQSDTREIDVKKIGKLVLYNGEPLNRKDTALWRSSYTDESKFEFIKYVMPEPTAALNLYIRDSATDDILWLYDNLLLKSFDAATVKWTEGTSTGTYTVAPLGNDSRGFQYTALCKTVSLPTDDAVCFGLHFKFNRRIDGINRYYAQSYDDINIGTGEYIRNITSIPNFIPEVGKFIGVSYYGYFDKYETNLEALQDMDMESFVGYENPVKVGNSILERVTYPRQLLDGQVVNDDWSELTYRNADLSSSAPHIIWYEIQDSGVFNIGLKNYQCVGATDTLLVRYTDPGRRTSVVDDKYTRGPDTFVLDFNTAGNTFNASGLWPTPKSFGYAFGMKDYDQVKDKLKVEMTIGEMLGVGKPIYPGIDDNYILDRISEMKSYRFNTEGYKEAIKQNYENKYKHIDGASGLTANDYRNMDITDQVIAPYTFESQYQKKLLTKFNDVRGNPHSDLYFMLDTYGVEVTATRYIRIKRDAKLAWYKDRLAKDYSGRLLETIPKIYTLYLTERTDDMYTHEFTNEQLLQNGNTRGIAYSDSDTLRTLHIEPSVKYIPSVEMDGNLYDYYELNYSVPMYGTWRETEYLDEDGQLYLVKEYGHSKEFDPGSNKLITNQSEDSALTYKTTHRTKLNKNVQHMHAYELGYACYDPTDITHDCNGDSEAATYFNKHLLVINKPASGIGAYKPVGTGKQCGDWAFISCDPYIWTVYNNQDKDELGSSMDYNSYVNLPGQVKDLTSFSVKLMSEETIQFPDVGYSLEHEAVVLQQLHKHPIEVDDSGFFGEFQYLQDMVIGVTTSEVLEKDTLTKDAVYVEFNNNGATHNVEARYALYILQSLAKTYLTSTLSDWNLTNPTDAQLTNILLNVDYENKANLHMYLEKLTYEEKLAIFKLMQKYRKQGVFYYQTSIKYDQGKGARFTMITDKEYTVLDSNTEDAKLIYGAMTYLASKYLAADLNITVNSGSTDRLANNMIFLAGMKPSITYRVSNVCIKLTSFADTNLYNSIELGLDKSIYTFADSKKVLNADDIKYTNNLVVWYAKVNPLIPIVSVKTPITENAIQPVIIKVTPDFDTEISRYYEYIVGIRITSPGTYTIYDADFANGQMKFTVTSSGIVFNTFYGPFNANNPEEYLNTGSASDSKSPTKRITENTYTTTYVTDVVQYNGISYSPDRYLYYVIANVSPGEAQKISKNISVTYDDGSVGTITMKEYTKGNDQGIYIMYHKIEAPGRYFMFDTSKTVTVLGVQPELVYAEFKYDANTGIHEIVRRANKQTVTGKDAKAMGTNGKDIDYYTTNSKYSLLAYWKYDPRVKQQVEYPGKSGTVAAKRITLVENGKKSYVYGIFMPLNAQNLAVPTSGDNVDGIYRVDSTQVLITSGFATNLKVGYPMFSDKQKLLMTPDGSEVLHSTQIRNAKWFPGINIFWVDQMNQNYQIEAKEYWSAQSTASLMTDTTFTIKNDDGSEKYLHRLMAPYPGTYTVKGITNEKDWKVILSPPDNFYIGTTTLKLRDNELVHLANSYQYRPSQDRANDHIRVLYLACGDYLVSGYYSAMMHEHDWNIRATWLNQPIYLYKTGAYRDNNDATKEELEYFTWKDTNKTLDTGKVFYAFDERIVKQHDAELERWESKLPSFHPLKAEIHLPDRAHPYEGGYGNQQAYHNSLPDKTILEALGIKNKGVSDLTATERQKYTEARAALLNFVGKGLGLESYGAGGKITIGGASYNSSDLIKAFKTETLTELLARSKDGQFLDRNMYPHEKQASGFYYASNVPAYANIGWNQNTDTPTSGAVSKVDRFGQNVKPSDSTRITMPTNPWAGSKADMRPEDGLNGMYYSNYRIKNDASKLSTDKSNKYDITPDTFIKQTGVTNNISTSPTDVLGNRFYNSDTYDVLSWFSNPVVTEETLVTSYKKLGANLPNKPNDTVNHTYVYRLNPKTYTAKINGRNVTINTGTGANSQFLDTTVSYGRAFGNTEEHRQVFHTYEDNQMRFWSPFDVSSGLVNYDVQGILYKMQSVLPHTVTCHPIYDYSTQRLSKYQHDMLLPADFSGKLKLPSYITDIDTAVINTVNPHDGKLYTGGFYTYTLYVGGHTGLILQANHTGEFTLEPKKSQHLKLRQTSPWGSYAEYDLNIIFATHLQKDMGDARLNQNIVDLTINVEDLTNPYHQDVSQSYRMDINNKTMSAGEYMPTVVTDLEADSPIYSQLLAVYMLYQDVPSYRYNDKGHMWMYDWFRRDGYHMNQYTDTHKNEVDQGFLHDHILTPYYTTIKPGGELEAHPATYYDTGADANATKDFLNDNLLKYTSESMKFKQATNDEQEVSTTTSNGYTNANNIGKNWKDIRSSQNMRTFIRFIDAMHGHDNKYTLWKKGSNTNYLLRNNSYSYLEAYNTSKTGSPKISGNPDLQLVNHMPWFFSNNFDGKKAYHEEGLDLLLDRYTKNNFGGTSAIYGQDYTGWSKLYNTTGPFNYPTRDWHHYYPEIPEGYEMPDGNISKDYLNMTSVLRNIKTPTGEFLVMFSDALDKILHRNILQLRRDPEDENTKIGIDMFNYMGTRTSIHVRSYQDCVNAIVYDSEAYDIMQTEIKPILELDYIQKPDLDSDSKFYVKSILDTFVNR